jgi:hypothetical protein
VGAAAQEEESENGLTENSLTINSLTVNSLTVNSLTVNSLTVNSLTVNSLVMSALEDAASQAVMKYIVGCALPAGAQVTLDIGGTNITYSGSLGLAPGWGIDSGTCDATCQAWVSGCVIARINYLGHVVPLSARGAVLSTTSDERAAYSNPDGVFFGDVFTQPQIRYACMPPGGELTRTCGQGNDPATCAAITYLGSCTSVCSTVGTDGSYQSCTDGNGTAYPGSVSVFLQPGQVIP